MKASMECGIRIRHVPLKTNPTPRPSSSAGRPGTANRPSTAVGVSSWSGVTTPEEEAYRVFDDLITEEYILRACGVDTLHGLITVQLTVDTTYQSLLDLGDIAKDMESLILDGSRISSVRDLGTGLRGLKKLSLNSCGLSELDGIGMLCNLIELSVRDNQITDVTALAMHDTVQTVDLHGNRLTDISVGDTVSSCPDLRSLILTGNPIERAPKYRLIISSMVPQLLQLDGSPVDRHAKLQVSHGMILEAASAMQLEQEELDDERRMELAIMGDDFMSDGRGGGEEGWGAAGQGECGVTPDVVPAGRSSASPAPGLLPDTGSDLTHGSSVVLAGSMASAMRRRRHSPQTGGLGRSTGGGRDGREAICEHGALEVLDEALRGEGASGDGRAAEAMQGSSWGRYCFGEGDVTALLMTAAEHQQALTRPLTSASMRSMSPQTRPLPSRSSPRPGPGGCGFGKRPNSAGKGSGSRTGSIGVSVSFDDAAEELWGSVDGEEVIAEGDKPGRGGSGKSSPVGGRRSSQSDRLRSPQSCLHQYLPPTSPHTQLNASRPTSVASPAGSRCSTGGGGREIGLCMGGIASVAPSAPFKVLLPSHLSDENTATGEDTSNSGADRLATSRVYSREGGGSAASTGSARDRTGRSVSVWDVSDDSDSSDTEHDSFGSHRVKRNLQNSTRTARSDKYSSLVHRDSVLRAGGADNVWGGLDREALAIDHETRRKMSVQNMTSREPSGTHICEGVGIDEGVSKFFAKSFPSQLLPASRRVGDVENEEADDVMRGGGGSSSSSAAAGGGRRNKLLEDVAGRSLGFDLKGSLAAINQWVDDMDSSDDEDGVGVAGAGLFASARGERGREAASGAAGPIGGDGGSCSSADLSAGAGKVLSREKILHMCTRREGQSGSSTPSGHMPSLDDHYYYGADSSEAYEENEIAFFDNNVEKSVGAGHSSHTRDRGGEKRRSGQDNRKGGARTAAIGVAPTARTGTSIASTAKGIVSGHGDNSIRQGDEESTAPPVRVSGREGSKGLGGKSRGKQGEVPQCAVAISAACAEPASAGTSHTASRDTPANRGDATFKQKDDSGPAVGLTDESLITMLGQPPKAVPLLRTKTGFQEFFRGVSTDRMCSLLRAAYSELNELEREAKVRKRMELLGDVLSTSI